MTNQEIKTVGQTIAQETQIGGNTAARVGGVVEGIGVALDNKDAANGYYQATINGGTITVNAPNYLLGSGGNLRIKMPSAGTTASTLTIGNASAVQLWYNGAAVSSTNTWEAGEIISVFYDGTRFMASNSQGGGGKAEKIKYDNSHSGLSSQNVQNAIDEIAIESSYEEQFAEFSLSAIDTTAVTYETPVNFVEGHSYKIKVTSNTPYSNKTSVLLRKILGDSTGQVTIFTMPAESTSTEYVYHCEDDTLKYFMLYASGKHTINYTLEIDEVIRGYEAEKIKYDNSQSGLASDNVQGALDLCSSKNELNYYKYTSGQYLDANGEPYTVTNQVHKLARYVVYGGAMVRIKGRSGGSSTLASARDANGVQVAQYEQGKNKNYTDDNAFATILPSDARYLYVTGNSGEDALPSVEIVNNVGELDKELESRSDYITIHPTEGAKYIKTNQGVGNICDFTDEENYVANAAWGYYLVECSEGDAFKLTGVGKNTPRLFCFLDSSMQILMVADESTSVTDVQLYAPVNSAYLIINVQLDSAFSLKKTVRTSSLNDTISNIEKDLTFQTITSLPQLNYSINGGVWKAYNSGVTSSLIYVGHLHGEKIQITPNPTKTTYKIAFFNAVPVVNQNVSYCAGTAAITSDEEYQVVPDDALYLWIRYKNGDNDLWYPSKIVLPYGAESTVATLKSAVETLANEMKDVNAEASGLTLYDYVGMKPTYKNKFGVTQLQTLPSWVASQACAVIGNYMIVGVTFDQGATAARVYDLESNTLLGTISFNFGTYYKPHANTICFGTEMPDANSPFPALYLSQMDSTGLANKGSEYGVLVYSISSSYTSTFLQAILPDKTDTDLMNKIGAGTPNYIIDRDNGFLWVVGYKTATWQSYDNIQTFTKFQLPLLSAGSEVILTNADVLDSFELPMYPYTAMQEGVFKNGRLYIQMGVNGTIQGMRVVNVDTQEIETSLQTTQIFSTEPQGLAFWKDEMVWYESGTSGILYKFNFY